MIANVVRPALCSIPLAICLLVLQVPTARIAPGIQLALLIVCGIAVYAVAALAFARGELRAITAAFR